ncbi:hypothetical protein J132_07143 [Termitomyces sp. J132]|nr:hypothetical protein J132_07143 [Termitomyces sp. J132]
MNSVYFPAHVVLVLRRIVNVLSSISISNQYILLKQAQADEERAKLHVINSKSSSALLDQEWPRSPQIGSGWSWPALLSTFTQMDLPMANDPLPPLKSQKNNRGPDTQRRLPLPETTKAAPPDTIHQLMQNPALCDPFRIPRYPLVLCHEYIGIGKLPKNEQDPVKMTGRSESVMKTKDALFSLSLSGLPSSFTSLMLSIVDSPAYANLTTKYLNEVFNPRTPDDPTVKYFSVTSRVDSVNIWHPFWFTKLVLDGAEEKYRNKLRMLWDQESSPVGTPVWDQEREWGNDGLVTVQSAQWGEFLGIMEGCDHWEMRGARGIEFGVDLPAIPAIGLGVSTSGHSGDGWALPDLGRFVGGWKKEQKIQADAAASMPPIDRGEQRKLEREKDDAIVKSSTDRLSVVVDWITEQMPSAPFIAGKSKTIIDSTEVAEKALSRSTIQKEGKTRTKNELASKKDLERFYVALSRKLYDEGL